MKPKEKRSSQKTVTIIASAILVLAHVAVLLAILWSWRYYSIQPSLFGSIVGIILCSMVIIDIIFFVGFNHKDIALKIVSTIMAVLLLVGGTVGSYALSKANGIVDNVLDDGKSDKYETFSGVFVCYDQNNRFTSLSDLAGKKVGMLVETSNGLTYIATNLLSKEKIDYATVDYKTNAEMMQGLLDGDVDAIVITSAYRNIYKGIEENAEENDSSEEAEVETVDLSQEEGGEEGYTIVETEESPFARYLPNLIDFYSFEEELKMDTQRSNKNLSTDPFNVLLIGYSRTDIGSTVGLADSIIVATINPQTYEVAMTSIARDSFVPIPCYGDEYDKINSGRSTSRACFIETVEKFLNMDIDYYMELDYLGLVQIVNVIGGIHINNPVSFTLDGIYVPAGENVFADGQMALQFCRERHHMPNGDFDRQQHQKEVIIEIAKAFVKSGSVSLALKAMEEASEWMSTDLTLSQLTSVFNLLLNTKNYTGIDTFDLVDFQNTRITGYGGIMYYSYSMRLPLWVYLIYQGSYDESLRHINNVMGNYDKVSQTRNLEFSLDTEYVRENLISNDYEHKFLYEPDPMPAYWANLVGYTKSQAQSWASANGVALNIVTIKSTDEGYDKAYEGLVVSQSPRYGSLVSEYGAGTITVMGPSKIDENKQVPDFIEHNYSKAIKWAKAHGIPYDIDFDLDVSGKVGDVIEQSPAAGTDIEKVAVLKLVVKAGIQEIKFDKNGHGSTPDPITVKTGDTKNFPSISDPNGEYEFLGWYTDPENGNRVYDSDDVSGNVTVYAHWKKIDKEHVHSWTLVDSKDATCDEEGYEYYECSCGDTKTVTIAIPSSCSVEPEPSGGDDPPGGDGGGDSGGDDGGGDSGGEGGGE
ncbi:MAG: LCP family protein [Erysipelotrichaceae bacterium]|nr:LCP family protein [Erysipelotrichaceae bacterium]